MSDLAVAANIGSGPYRTPPVGLGAYETANEVLAAIAPQLNELVTVKSNEAAQRGADAAKKDVWMAGLIGGGIGIVGGGLLGLVLARKFR